MSEAIHHLHGPALVLAGPGSGKTRTVVHRTVHLLGAGVDPEEITLVTFTRKAAGEMRHRLEALLGEKVQYVFISTFHGLSARVLKMSRPGLQVLGDPEDLMKRVLAELEAAPKIKARAVLGAISRVRNSLERESEERVLEGLRRLYPDLEPWAGRAYLRYREEKARLGLLDYDDLLHFAADALEEDEELRALWGRRARFFTIDEYQDTNSVQFRLVRALLGEEENLMVVGDPNQAIYAWRGANPGLILDFQKQFPNARIYTLATNYRSHRGVVEASVEVLRKGGSVHILPLEATREGPPPVKVVSPDEPTEGLFIAEAVKKVLEEGIPPKEVAVLFRSLAYSRHVEAGLRRYGIPYTVVGNVGFWERREVKLILDFLRAPKDPLALSRLAQLFLDGIGPKRAERVVEEGPSFLEGVKGGRELLSWVEAFRSLYGLKGIGLARRAEELIRNGGFRDYVFPLLLIWSDGDREDALDRWETVREVLSALRAWAEREREGDLPLFLADLEGSEESGEGVQLMTIHASKGLEFHTVFLASLVEGRFPTRRSTDLAEELRLFYVGLTRAKEKVYLSFPESTSWSKSGPSRFFVWCPGRRVEYNPSLGWHGDQTDTVEELGKLFG